MSASALLPWGPADLNLSVKRVLVADDSADGREALRMLLSSHGYDVRVAGDGADALELALSQRPDLVLTDFLMPRLNGYELATALASHAETRDVPVVIFSGSPSRRQLRGLEPGRFTLLEKPMSNDALIAAVRERIGRSRPSEPPAAPAAAPAPEPAWSAEPGELLIEKAARREPEDQPRLDDTADSPLVEQLNRLVIRGVELGASDLHFEPQTHELTVRARVDGRLRRIGGFPTAFRARVTARLKVMANMVITEQRRPQDGQIRALYKGRRLDFRVSTMPGLHGEKVVVRLLGLAAVHSSPAELGLRARDRDSVEWALKAAHGMILVTGPTGSGKSTTLYTMVNVLNSPGVNIMTVEDPVEREIAGVTQVAVKPALGLTFDAVLRSFLRQDPDVMLVGEIRDAETATVAVKAANTGHLVLSTLHTNGAAEAVSRLANMGVPPYLLAASLRLVIAQRLIRTLCPSCKKLAPTKDEDLLLLPVADQRRLFSSCAAVGCDECGGTGYKGRAALFEVMPVRSVRMRARVASPEGAAALSAAARDEGMRTLREAALDAVASGTTSLAEVMQLVASD